MISYYLNILKIKLKYFITFLYFDLYKSYVNVFLTFFKGPEANLSFFDCENDIFLDKLTSDSRYNSVISPFFVFILINHGFWEIFNLHIWLGSNLISVKPRLNILENNLRNVPLKRSKNNFEFEILSYHMSMMERIYFLKLILLLFFIEIYVIYIYFKYLNDFFFFILVLYFLMPFFYLKIFNIFKYCMKYLNTGMKLIFLKPVSFYSSNKRVDIGHLNQQKYLGFLAMPSIGFFIRKISRIPFKLKVFYRTLLNDIEDITFADNKKKIEYQNVAFMLSNYFYNALYELWEVGFKLYKVDMIHFKHAWRRLLFFTFNYQKFSSLFINFNLIRKISILYFDHIKILIESENIYIYFKKLYFKYNFLILFLLLYQIYIYIYLYNNIYFNLLFILLICFFLIIDYIIYKNKLKNVKSMLLEYYIINFYIKYNKDITFCVNPFNRFRVFYMMEDFSLSNYLELLKIELNISILESIMLDIDLENEYLYSKKNITLNTENLDLINQTLLNKYSIPLKKQVVIYNYIHNENINFHLKKIEINIASLAELSISELFSDENYILKKNISNELLYNFGLTFDEEEGLLKELSELDKQFSIEHNDILVEPIKSLSDLVFLNNINNKAISNKVNLYNLPNLKMNSNSYYTYPNFGGKDLIFYEKRFDDYILKEYYYTFYGIKLIK